MSMLLETKDNRLPQIKGKSEFIQAEKVDVSDKAKEKIRMQMVNWLMENKKEEINKINDQHSLLIAWIDYYVSTFSLSNARFSLLNI